MDNQTIIKAVYTGPERLGLELEEFCDQSRIFDLRSSQWEGEIGRLPAADVPKYLSKFGYKASTPDTWFEEATKSAEWPKLSLGDINGHFEGNGHTWYNLLCHIKVASVSASHWRVPRRLRQMRTFLHDPIKAELGSDYKRHFETTRFAAHGAPPGTTEVIQAWLKTLCRCINEGELSPNLVALTLRFLEAEAVFDADDQPIDRKILKGDHRLLEGAASQAPNWAQPEVAADSSADAQLPDNLTPSPRPVAEDLCDDEASSQASRDSQEARAVPVSSSEAPADLQGVASVEEAAPCPADMALLWPQETQDKADDAVLPQLAEDAALAQGEVDNAASPEQAEEEDDGKIMSEVL
eukprot:TRINITY_DN39117_c0_g1_i1.p1 TRINITY_DN39117_c0_g1~~TRINITY_DN39117_c0_g1_i1.p1  ORF type:complete len:353 (+),score=87.93 TRINITY_DN39117_c0_g1_i1:49-1107(+)